MDSEPWARGFDRSKSKPFLFAAPPEWFLGHPAGLWPSRLGVNRATAVRIAAAVVDLVLPEWRATRSTDTAPLRAVKAALANPAGEDEGLRRHARALAKACSDSRRRSLGFEHRIAEAARAVASASAATTEAAALQAVGEALEKTEEHLLYRFEVDGIYGKEAEIREQMLHRAVAASEPTVQRSIPADTPAADR